MLENFQQVSAWIESQQNTEWPNNRSGKKAKDLFDVLVAATTQAEVESAAKAFVDAVKGNYNAADLQTALAADIEAVQKAEAEAAEQERLEQEQAEKARAAQEAREQAEEQAKADAEAERQAKLVDADTKSKVVRIFSEINDVIGSSPSRVRPGSEIAVRNDALGAVVGTLAELFTGDEYAEDLESDRDVEKEALLGKLAQVRGAVQTHAADTVAIIEAIENELNPKPVPVRAPTPQSGDELPPPPPTDGIVDGNTSEGEQQAQEELRLPTPPPAPPATTLSESGVPASLAENAAPFEGEEDYNAAVTALESNENDAKDRVEAMMKLNAFFASRSSNPEVQQHLGFLTQHLNNAQYEQFPQVVAVRFDQELTAQPEGKPNKKEAADFYAAKFTTLSGIVTAYNALSGNGNYYANDALEMITSIKGMLPQKTTEANVSTFNDVVALLRGITTEDSSVINQINAMVLNIYNVIVENKALVTPEFASQIVAQSMHVLVHSEDILAKQGPALKLASLLERDRIQKHDDSAIKKNDRLFTFVAKQLKELAKLNPAAINKVDKQAAYDEAVEKFVQQFADRLAKVNLQDSTSAKLLAGNAFGLANKLFRTRFDQELSVQLGFSLYRLAQLNSNQALAESVLIDTLLATRSIEILRALHAIETDSAQIFNADGFKEGLNKDIFGNNLSYLVGGNLVLNDEQFKAAIQALSASLIDHASQQLREKFDAILNPPQPVVTVIEDDELSVGDDSDAEDVIAADANDNAGAESGSESEDEVVAEEDVEFQAPDRDLTLDERKRAHACAVLINDPAAGLVSKITATPQTTAFLSELERLAAQLSSIADLEVAKNGSLVPNKQTESVATLTQLNAALSAAVAKLKDMRIPQANKAFARMISTQLESALAGEEVVELVETEKQREARAKAEAAADQQYRLQNVTEAQRAREQRTREATRTVRQALKAGDKLGFEKDTVTKLCSSQKTGDTPVYFEKGTVIDWQGTGTGYNYRHYDIQALPVVAESLGLKKLDTRNDEISPLIEQSQQTILARLDLAAQIVVIQNEMTRLGFGDLVSGLSDTSDDREGLFAVAKAMDAKMRELYKAEGDNRDAIVALYEHSGYLAAYAMLKSDWKQLFARFNQYREDEFPTRIRELAIFAKVFSNVAVSLFDKDAKNVMLLIDAAMLLKRFNTAAPNYGLVLKAEIDICLSLSGLDKLPVDMRESYFRDYVAANSQLLRNETAEPELRASIFVYLSERQGDDVVSVLQDDQTSASIKASSARVLELNSQSIQLHKNMLEYIQVVVAELCRLLGDANNMNPATNVFQKIVLGFNAYFEQLSQTKVKYDVAKTKNIFTDKSSNKQVRELLEMAATTRMMVFVAEMSMNKVAEHRQQAVTSAKAFFSASQVEAFAKADQFLKPVFENFLAKKQSNPLAGFDSSVEAKFVPHALAMMHQLNQIVERDVSGVVRSVTDARDYRLARKPTAMLDFFARAFVNSIDSSLHLEVGGDVVVKQKGSKVNITREQLFNIYKKFNYLQLLVILQSNAGESKEQSWFVDLVYEAEAAVVDYALTGAENGVKNIVDLYEFFGTQGVEARVFDPAKLGLYDLPNTLALDDKATLLKTLSLCDVGKDSYTQTAVNKLAGEAGSTNRIDFGDAASFKTHAQLADESAAKAREDDVAAQQRQQQADLAQKLTSLKGIGEVLGNAGLQNSEEGSQDQAEAVLAALKSIGKEHEHFQTLQNVFVASRAAKAGDSLEVLKAKHSQLESFRAAEYDVADGALKALVENKAAAYRSFNEADFMAHQKRGKPAALTVVMVDALSAHIELMRYVTDEASFKAACNNIGALLQHKDFEYAIGKDVDEFLVSFNSSDADAELSLPSSQTFAEIAGLSAEALSQAVANKLLVIMDYLNATEVEATLGSFLSEMREHGANDQFLLGLRQAAGTSNAEVLDKAFYDRAMQARQIDTARDIAFVSLKSGSHELLKGYLADNTVAGVNLDTVKADLAADSVDMQMVYNKLYTAVSAMQEGSDKSFMLEAVTGYQQANDLVAQQSASMGTAAVLGRLSTSGGDAGITSTSGGNVEEVAGYESPVHKQAEGEGHDNTSPQGVESPNPFG